MKILISILIALTATSAIAVTLAPIPAPPSVLLPIDTSAPLIACDKILDELTKFKDMNRQHEDSVSAFLGQTVEKITGWYDLLAPLEGSTTLIDVGTFAPIQDGSDKMSRVVDYSYDNAALLAAELDRIIVSLRDCSPAIRKR